MATINEKEIMNFLIERMDKSLPDWFKPFGHPFISESKKFVVLDAKFGSTGKAPNWPEDVIPLAYVPHNINCVPMGSGNCVVISSQFSGCLMAAFTNKGSKLSLDQGQRYVCHIAIEDRENGDECETTFSDAISEGEIDDVILFNPAAIVPITNRDTFTKAAAGLGYDVNFRVDVHGLISSDNECFSFIVGRKKDTNKPHVLSIVKWANGGRTAELSYSINVNLNVLLKQ